MPISNPYLENLGLRKNPFSKLASYSEDADFVYVPEMFGGQHGEFLRKFILGPLEQGQSIIGAVWSVVPGDPAARGFGKSTLMGEEAKRINRDFGEATLRSQGVKAEEARANPILAGYVSFNVKGSGGIASIEAAAFHLVRFIIRSRHGEETVHGCLRERAAARLIKEGRAGSSSELDAIVAAVKERFTKLAVNVDIRGKLEEYLWRLASPDTEELERFLGQDVGAWHHDRNGLKYLQILVVFAELAGIQHFTFFIDQVEDFATMATRAKIMKNVKIIRDALIEAEPFRSRASFVFQLHPDAYERLKDAWQHEDLPSLFWADPLAEPVVTVLEGLTTFSSARLLAERCLNDRSVVLPNRKKGISPFTEKALEKVWQATKPRPRWFIHALYSLLELGKTKQIYTIDEAFVAPKIEYLITQINQEDNNPELAGDDRLL